MNQWIDFKQLRERLKFEQVFAPYRIPLNLKRDGQHQGPCPLPNHVTSKQSPSFSANLARGIFQCFGCKAKGNVLEFAALMEKVDPKNVSEFRKVALKMQNLFCEPAQLAKEPALPEHADERTLVNAPLDFELKGLDQNHPYLRERGIRPETADYFGLGVASRGLLKDRLAIPLHDQEARLVGYAGRILYDQFITKENPRYLFPDRRERLGVVHEFQKSRFLYNGSRMGAYLEDLFVVEGFQSVWWLHQNGYPSTVATMRSECSAGQVDLIVSMTTHRSRVWVMSNGDLAGDSFAESVVCRVSPYRFVRWVRCKRSVSPLVSVVGRAVRSWWA